MRGLSVHTLDAWRRRMAQSGFDTRLVSVEIVEDGAASSSSTQAGGVGRNGQFRVVLAHGLRIEVEPGLRMFHKAARSAAIGNVPTHTLRHSYRSWLDAVGTPIAVQQKLMRHSDIRTTMNIYGDVVTDEMAQAHSKVVGLALSSRKPD
jgi:hypothetical protein